MRHKTRERVMRLFLASLLESDLSTRELKEVAIDLTEQRFSWEFGKILHDTIMHLSDLEVDKQLPYHRDEFDKIAYEIVQRRRIAKKVLIDFIGSVSQDLGRSVPFGPPVRQILKEFFSLASREEANHLMEMLEGGKADAYLKGIMQRG